MDGSDTNGDSEERSEPCRASLGQGYFLHGKDSLHGIFHGLGVRLSGIC